MSNLRNTTRLPLRTSMTNKRKSYALTNDQLERKTRALEGSSLNKLKLTTQGDQTKSTMETYRRVKQRSQHSRDKPIVRKQITKCGQCEKDEAKMKCLECVEIYCSNCYSQFHLRGALQRHHSVLLSTLSKKNSILNTESNTDESGEIQNENTNNVLSFQQSFLQWRENNINKSNRIQQKRGLISSTLNRIDDQNKLPSIDVHSSKTTSSDENFLSKKSRPINQETFNQHLTKTNLMKLDQPKINVRVRIHHSFSDHTSLVDIDPSADVLSTTQSEILPVIDKYNLTQNEEQERPVTHISIKSLSRPTSTSIKKDFIPSRSNSITIPEQSLRSILDTKSTDELEAIVDSQLVISRPSSSSSSFVLEKHDQPSTWRPSQSTSNNIDAQLVVIDQNIITQFDSVLDDLFDESKIELAYQINSAKDQPSAHISAMNSTTTTPRRHSPFSFSNSLYKMSRINSSSSRDTGDGGFFTDVLPRQIISTPPPPTLPPPPILECSTSNEWKHALENQSTESNPIALPKLSIPNLSRVSSKHSITHEEIVHRLKSQITNDSRPSSSLSSSSLPVSISSSKPDFNKSITPSSTASSRKSSSSSTSTLKKSSSITTKDSSSPSVTTKTSSAPTSTSKETTTATSKDTFSETTTTTKTSPVSTSKDTSSETTSTTKTSPIVIPEPTLENSSSSSSELQPILPIVTKDEKVPSPCDIVEYHQELMHLLRDKTPSNAEVSEDTNNSIEPTSTFNLSREVNITENDLPTQKRTRRHIRRQTTTSDESSQYRKLEFSVGDGLKWQEASMESMSSIQTIISKQVSVLPAPQSLSPSNLLNTKLAEQFSKYDNDDGRSSRADQNLNDEECFNQLCQELCSGLDADEDALLKEPLLKILQSIKKPFPETKLRENESIHQLDNDDLLIHE